jgi:hypothetical protein
VAWSVGRIVGPLYDRRRDGTRLALLGRLEADLRCREALLQVAREPALSWLRRRLRAGEASFAAAVAIVKASHELWGISEADGREPRRRARRRELADVLGPRALRGPVTPLEWERFREARARAPRDRELWRRALGTLPRERVAGDDVFFDEALEAMRAGVHRHGQLFATALAMQPRPEDERRLEDAIAICGDARGTLATYLGGIRRRLGIVEVKDDEAAPQDAKRAPEWMDLDDES